MKCKNIKKIWHTILDTFTKDIKKMAIIKI